MTVELDIVTGKSWANFCLKHLVGTAPTIESINEMLKPYNGQITDERAWSITFDTEQDRAFFMLKY